MKHNNLAGARSSRSSLSRLRCLPLLGLALSTTPAYAGNWVISHYEANGQSTWSPPHFSSDGLYPSPQVWPVRGAAFGVDFYAYASAPNVGPNKPPANLSAQVKGTITIVAKWVPATGKTLLTDPPPSTCSVLVRSFAQGSGVDDDSKPVNPPNVTLDNGLVGSGGNPFPITGGWDVADEWSFSKVQDGRRLLRGPSNGQSEVRFPITIDVKSTLTATAPSTNSVSTRIAVCSNIDDRSVKLTRNSKDRFEVGADGNYVTYGKTCYSYKGSAVGGVYRTTQSFTPTYSGDWSQPVNLRVAWDWSGGSPLESTGDLDYIYWAKRRSPLGGLTQETYATDAFGAGGIKWKGNGVASQTATLNYNVTDNGDGAKATAKYVLEIHEPIEVGTHQTYKMWAYAPAWGTGSNPGNPNGVAQFNGPLLKDGQNNPSVTVGQAKAKGQTFVVSGELGIEAVGGALGISQEWSQEQTVSAEQTVPINIDVPANKFTYPVMEFVYIRHEIWFRHFTEEGEHELPRVEAPPCSGYYDTPSHSVISDEPTGATLMWAPPLDIITDRVPPFTTTPPPLLSRPSAGRS